MCAPPIIGVKMLDRLKEKADELGIKYRSDIKEAKLIEKIEAFIPPKPEVVEVKASPYSLYKNTSKVNVFTEAGKCSPNRMVELTPDEATKYASLELCEK